jgi:phosphate transport system substrate-binding protein
VSSGGSGQGIRAVIDRTTDFGMLARGVRDSEKERIPNYREFLVGIDALTVAIHPENPLLETRNGLTTEEIVKIFSGEYARWSDLDPSLPNEEIVVIVRDIGGGAHEVFQTNIMGDVDVKATAIQAPSMGALVTRVTENRNAIGYASYGISNQNAGRLVPLEVDGIAPTSENIINGTYVIQRPLLLAFSGEPTAIQQSFLDVLLGDVGQQTVEQMGFIRVD